MLCIEIFPFHASWESSAGRLLSYELSRFAQKGMTAIAQGVELHIVMRQSEINGQGYLRFMLALWCYWVESPMSVVRYRSISGIYMSRRDGSRVTASAIT